MVFKKVYTQIPVCSLGQTPNGIKDCAICDAATSTTPYPVTVPENQAVPIGANIDKYVCYGGDFFVVTLEYDKYLNPNDVLVKLSPGLTEEKREYLDHRYVRITIRSDVYNLGKKNICVGYMGINRYFHVEVIKAYPKIVNIIASPSTLKQGENSIVTVVLNRELEIGEEMPFITINTDAFIYIDEIKPLPITKASLKFTLQAKADKGTYEIMAQFPGSLPVTTVIQIEEEEDLVWATKEDIDGLFDELGETVPPGEIPESTDRYATKEDIDALFPELAGERED